MVSAIHRSLRNSGEDEGNTRPPDHAAAEGSWRQARSELASFLKEQPENYSLIGILALTNVGLGDKAAALAFTETTLDTVRGPTA